MKKQFFMLSELAAYLAHATGEPFSVGDVVRLIRSEKLSVYFEYSGEIISLRVIEHEEEYSIGVLDFDGILQSRMPPFSGDELNHPLLSVKVVEAYGKCMSHKERKLVRGGTLPTERPDGGLIRPDCTVHGYIEDSSIQVERWLIHSDEIRALTKAASPAPAPSAAQTEAALEQAAVTGKRGLTEEFECNPDTVRPRSEWKPKLSIERAPGYRWPLYQLLKTAHAAGGSCPKPREVLEIWKFNPPLDIEVMTDGVKYNDGLGNQREANLKAIGQAIKGLLT